MAKRHDIHPNEFILEYKSKTCVLSTKKPLNKKLPKIEKTSNIWFNLIQIEPEISNLGTPCLWIFFIDEKNSLKGIHKMSWNTFRKFETNEVVDITSMVGVSKIVFAINQVHIQNIYSDSFEVYMTKNFQRSLIPFKIELLDTLMVNRHSFFSLKEENLI